MLHGALGSSRYVVHPYPAARFGGDLPQDPNMGNLYVRIRAGVRSDPHPYRDCEF